MRGCAQAEPPEVLLPTGVVSACWQQALDADPALAADLGPDGREPLHAVEEISVADEA
jgi:peptide/nickel transport system ATP-binding protein